MNIHTKIERANFLASEADIESMAHQKQEGDEFATKTAGTYLRIMVALTAADIGGKTACLSRRRGRAAQSLTADEVSAHMESLDRVSARCYAAVTRAVVSPDIAKREGLTAAEQTRRSLERNRRTNYARTALTALRMYVAAGRDVRDLTPVTVTKEALRDVAERFMPPPASIQAGRLARAASRNAKSLSAETTELATLDPAQAEHLLHTLMLELQATLDRVRSGELPDAVKLAA